MKQPVQKWNTTRASAMAAAVLAALLFCIVSRAIAQDSVQSLRELSRTFNSTYEQVKPAVAQIATTRQWRSARSGLPQFHPQIPEEALRGLGSGTIVSNDGYILSNYHVIEGADSILVTLADRRTFEAEVVGFDSLIDIALLKIEAYSLPHVRLGDSSQLQIGDWVLAIGHPLGMGSTLTHGIISALDRRADIFGGSGYAIESFIQTNAVINPGNSGGPLLNLDGEVIGINTAISTRTGYYMGYGLAVPVNLAHEAMNDILLHGRVVRGYMGIVMDGVTQEIVRERGLQMDIPRGVLVTSVSSGGPADRSGLRDGDIILAIDGQEINSPNQIQSLIYGRDPGEYVRLSLLTQDSREDVLEVLLGEREEDLLLAQGKNRLLQLGLSVETLPTDLAAELGFTPAVAEELGFDTGEGPVVVTAVDSLSPAAHKGIKVRDVITEIDQERVTSLPQFVRVLSSLEEGRSALFWFWRSENGVDVRALRMPQ
jgi:serine protease Do